MRGFTLIELIITVIIISVLIAIGVPSYRIAIERSRLSEAHNILAAMRKIHLVCGSMNGSTCNNINELRQRGFENTTLKYFDEPAVQNTTDISNPGNTDIVAKIKRKTGSSFGSYTVCVNLMGNITCNGTACVELGMESAGYCNPY